MRGRLLKILLRWSGAALAGWAAWLWWLSTHGYPQRGHGAAGGTYVYVEVVNGSADLVAVFGWPHPQPVRFPVGWHVGSREGVRFPMLWPWRRSDRQWRLPGLVAGPGQSLMLFERDGTPAAREETIGPPGRSLQVFASFHAKVSLLWLMAIGGLVWAPPLWRLVRLRLRSGRGQGLGFCRTCGYDMRATPDRCPECGFVPRSRRVGSGIATPNARA